MTTEPELKETIIRLRKFIVIHSCLYYYLNSPVISDDVFDEVCKQLVNFHKEHGETWEFMDDEFKGFDGATGMHLGNYDMVKRFSGPIYRILKYYVALEDVHNVKFYTY